MVSCAHAVRYTLHAHARWHIGELFATKACRPRMCSETIPTPHSWLALLPRKKNGEKRQRFAHEDTLFAVSFCESGLRVGVTSKPRTRGAHGPKSKPGMYGKSSQKEWVGKRNRLDAFSPDVKCESTQIARHHAAYSALLTRRNVASPGGSSPSRAASSLSKRLFQRLYCRVLFV